MTSPGVSYQLGDLQRINTLVNTNTDYMTDAAHYDVPEYWEAVGAENRRGDCEDYALAKLKALRGLGWRKEDLNIAYCKDQTGANHAVLIARLGDVDYCLDNQRLNVTAWTLVPYDWQSMTRNGNFLDWVEITA